MANALRPWLVNELVDVLATLPKEENSTNQLDGPAKLTKRRVQVVRFCSTTPIRVEVSDGALILECHLAQDVIKAYER